MAEPLFVQGPEMEGAVAMEILLPVLNRKYVPSDERRIRAGSCTLQDPLQAPGLA